MIGAVPFLPCWGLLTGFEGAGYLIPLAHTGTGSFVLTGFFTGSRFGSGAGWVFRSGTTSIFRTGLPMSMVSSIVGGWCSGVKLFTGFFYEGVEFLSGLCQGEMDEVLKV